MEERNHQDNGRRLTAATSLNRRNNLVLWKLVIVAIVIIHSIVTSTLVHGKKPKKTIKQKLLQDGIIPDVIDDIPDGANVTVEFPSGARANYGNELTPTQVKDIPTLNWSAKENELYMVVVLSPDAMTRNDHEFRSIVEWLVVNIPGKDVEEGDTLAEYFGAGPPEGTGIHRYVYLVYAQKDHHINSTMNIKKNTLSGRTKFSIREFAGSHWSKPVAANYYFAKFDEQVVELQKQLSGASTSDS